MSSIASGERHVIDLERKLVVSQAVAGALFAVFLVMHLSNIAVAPLGAETFNQHQQFLRQFYQQPVFELMFVIFPVITHLVAGIWLAVLRRGRRGKRAMFQRVHTWAGVFLALFIIEHITATRGASFFYGVYPGFEGISFTFRWIPEYFYPYYFLLALAGFYHGSNGVRMLLARAGMRVSPRFLLPMATLAAIWIAIAIMSFGGLLFEIHDPLDNDYARLWIEEFDAKAD